jgi:YD repeat-containing protein
MGNINALGNVPGANPAIENYSYHPLYRLTAVTDNGTAVEGYTYNGTGDRLSKTSAAGMATGTYGYQTGTHRLTAIGSAARSYDANGNTIGSASGGQTFGFGYDDRNKLSLVQANQQTVATYVYNALAQRIAKVTVAPGANSQRFVYDESSRLTSEIGATTRGYVSLGDVPVAIIDTMGSASVSYVQADWTAQTFSALRGRLATLLEDSFGSGVLLATYLGKARLLGAMTSTCAFPANTLTPRVASHITSIVTTRRQLVAMSRATPLALMVE